MRRALAAVVVALVGVAVMEGNAMGATGLIHFQSARGVDCYYDYGGSAYGGKLGGAPRDLFFSGGVYCNRAIPGLMVWTNIFNERLGEPDVPPMQNCANTASCYQSIHQVRTDTLDTYYASFNFNVDLRGSGDTFTVWPEPCTVSVDRNYLNCLVEPAYVYYPAP